MTPVPDVDEIKGRYFEGGAYRDTDQGKPDYEGYLSPFAIEAFGRYMLRHQRQSDGEIRDSDNWQKGIPLSAYMKSGWRHFVDWWYCHRQYQKRPEGFNLAALEEALCALMFNVMGYLHELMKLQGRE